MIPSYNIKATKNDSFQNVINMTIINIYTNHMVFLRETFMLYLSLSSLSTFTVLFWRSLIFSTGKGPIGKVELNESAKVFNTK